MRIGERSKHVHWASFILIQLTVIFFILFLVDWSCGKMEAHDKKHAFAAFYTTNGVLVSPVSTHDVKLVLDPFTGYKNVALQKGDGFTTNELGLRGPAPSADRKKKRVLLIGGSAAFGLGIHGDEATLSSRLSEMLDAEVLNAGVIGYTSKQELAFLISELVALKPDLVITFDGWNDFHMKDQGAAWKSQASGFLWMQHQLEVSRCASEGSFFFRIWRVFYDLFPHISKAIVGPMPRNFGDRWTKLPSQKLSAIANNYAENHQKMLRVGKGFGFKVFTVLQPSSEDKDGGYAEFRRTSTQLISEADGMTLDLNTPSFERIFTNDRFIPKGIVHLNDEGTALAAKAIADRIREDGLLSDKTRP